MRKSTLVVLTLSVGGFCGSAAAGAVKDAEAMKDQVSRSEGTTPAVGMRGVVAGSQPLAVQVGVDILRSGGNAVDAAIAVNAMLGFVEPMSCGVGGGLFTIVWDAKTRKPYGLNASGRSPYKTSLELFRARGLKSVPSQGPLSWSVPGCVDGWEMLRKRFGSMSLEQILAPAVRHAENGH